LSSQVLCYGISKVVGALHPEQPNTEDRNQAKSNDPCDDPLPTPPLLLQMCPAQLWVKRHVFAQRALVYDLPRGIHGCAQGDVQIAPPVAGDPPDALGKANLAGVDDAGLSCVAPLSGTTEKGRINPLHALLPRGIL